MQILNFIVKRKISWLAVIFLIIIAIHFFSPSLNFWPRNLMLTWMESPATSQTITWHTGRYVSRSLVEYRETNDQNTNVVREGSAEQVVTDMGMIIVHSVQLAELKPGTAYQYRVGDGLFWSSYHTFTTARMQIADFKFLIFGDSQGNSYEWWQRTVQTAFDRNRNAVFIMNLGDLVDFGLNYSHWEKWFQAGRGVIDAIPVMPVMGNHGTYVAASKFAPPHLYRAFFQLPTNGPPPLQDQVYSFDYGEAHFSILDSQRLEETEWIPEMLSLQQAWLEKDLSETSKRWKLVLIHRPLYDNRPSDLNRPMVDDGELMKAFVPILERHRVDVVFSGHDHVYARSYPIFDGMWTDEQGRGPVYVAVGRSGERTHDKFQSKKWDVVFHNPMKEPNYLTVEVSNNRLSLKAFSLNGEVIDEWIKNSYD